MSPASGRRPDRLREQSYHAGMNLRLIEQLIAMNPGAYQELVPRDGPPAEARKLLDGTSVDDLFPKLTRPVYAFAALAGLWLRNDALDESHAIVQQSPAEILAGYRKPVAKVARPNDRYDDGETTLAFWHGIMHRREGDFGNAKYWFRRVGPHPVFGGLAKAAREEAAAETAASNFARAFSGVWEPFRFVDLCEQSERTRDADATRLLVRIAFCEWQLLFDYCCRAAKGE